MKTDTKPTFLHNGVTITLESNGKFAAMGAEGRITSSSLDGIKKRLDKNEAFKPFKAFRLVSHYDHKSGISLDQIEECTVVGIAEPRRRYNSRAWKITAEGRHGTMEAYLVYEDTPENRKQAKAYLELERKNAKARKEAEAAEKKAKDAIKSRTPPEKKS